MRGQRAIPFIGYARCGCFAKAINKGVEIRPVNKDAAHCLSWAFGTWQSYAR
jgi:hypothetical protein